MNSWQQEDWESCFWTDECTAQSLSALTRDRGTRKCFAPQRHGSSLLVTGGMWQVCMQSLSSLVGICFSKLIFQDQAYVPGGAERPGWESPGCPAGLPLSLEPVFFWSFEVPPSVLQAAQQQQSCALCARCYQGLNSFWIVSTQHGI